MKRKRVIPKGIVAMGISRPVSGALELTVELHFDDDEQLCARFDNGEPCISFIPSSMIGLIGHMCACKLLADGYDPERQLIVRLQGADYDLLRAPLGCAAAQPLVNFDAPVSEPMSVVYKRQYAA